MQAHSVDQPSAPLVHRPMSLLLQALKQIESKAPTLTAAQMPYVHIAGDSQVASPGRGPCQTYELIHHYQESETISEIAAAGPAHVLCADMVTVPLLPPAESVARAVPEDKSQRRFAEDVAGLLPDEDRAVIAITSLGTTDLWPLIRELCLGLAARGGGAGGEVLAIAEGPPGLSRKPASRLHFTDLLSGRGAWPDALSPDAQGRFNIVERGDLDFIKLGAGRSLLKLWQELSDRFAYVVIDAGSCEADSALPLLASCDATFVAVRLNVTRRRSAERWLARIRSVGGRPCGCLVVE